MDIVSTRAGFLLAAGFIGVATVGFVVSARRAQAVRTDVACATSDD
jgi:hypothetical protein